MGKKDAYLLQDPPNPLLPKLTATRHRGISIPVYSPKHNISPNYQTAPSHTPDLLTPYTGAGFTNRGPFRHPNEQTRITHVPNPKATHPNPRNTLLKKHAQYTKSKGNYVIGKTELLSGPINKIKKESEGCTQGAYRER